MQNPWFFNATLVPVELSYFSLRQNHNAHFCFQNYTISLYLLIKKKKILTYNYNMLLTIAGEKFNHTSSSQSM